MIAVETESGELVKIIKNVIDSDFGWHKSFGFISRTAATKRNEAKKRAGHDFVSDKWFCSFKIFEQNNTFAIADTVGCAATKSDSGWLLETPNGKFKLVQSGADYVNSLLQSEDDKARWLNKAVEAFLVVALILMPIIYLYEQAPVEEEVLEEEKMLEPVVVKIIEPARVVNVNQEANPDIKVKPLTQAEISKQAVKRNLGFLGMVGSKDMKKVTGGVPQELSKATAGAGAGGDAGSGGEVLTGLGKGLKKTTVGNTGVQGLGGIGTKGAGGGKGGYGNTLVASGTGTGISAIAVSNSDMVLQGGISRYAINATIAKYLNQVRRCYETELKTKPELQGLVEMSFEINSAGRLNFANVSKTTLKDAPTEKCISEKMMTWQFPQPKGGVKVPVKYPFMLRPVGS